MIEIKLSQGAKPGHGGILPAAKVTPEIAEIRGVPERRGRLLAALPHGVLDAARAVGSSRSCASCPAASRSASSLHRQAARVPGDRQGDARDRHLADFITVDGGEGGTGAAPLEFSNAMGSPLIEGLMLVHSALVGAGIRDQMRIGASGKW